VIWGINSHFVHFFVLYEPTREVILDLVKGSQLEGINEEQPSTPKAPKQCYWTPPKP